MKTSLQQGGRQLLSIAACMALDILDSSSSCSDPQQGHVGRTDPQEPCETPLSIDFPGLARVWLLASACLHGRASCTWHTGG